MAGCNRRWLVLLMAAGCATGTAPAPRAPAQPTAAEASMLHPVPPPGASAEGVEAPATLIVKQGLAAPESVLYDIESDVYLVSNVNGSPADADDNGFISRIAPDGTVLAARFIDGERPDIQLHAPKGMAISAGVLFVADLDRLRKFDAVSGAPLGEILVKGATFVNDVTAGPDGTIYFSDTGIRGTAKGFDRTGSDAVYKIVKDKPKLLASGKQLDGPNGLIADHSGVWVVTFGGNQLYNVKSGSKSSVQHLPHGILDGIVKTSTGKLYVSSWESNEVLVSSPGEGFSTAFSVSSPADIGYDVKRNRLLIPLMMENTLQLQPL